MTRAGTLAFLEAAALEAIGAIAPESHGVASRGSAIDDDGRIIGVSGVMEPPGAVGERAAAADESVVLARVFLWTERTGVVDLNDSLTPGSPRTLEAAVAFDASGRIIGLGLHQGQRPRVTDRREARRGVGRQFAARTPDRWIHEIGARKTCGVRDQSGSLTDCARLHEEETALLRLLVRRSH